MTTWRRSYLASSPHFNTNRVHLFTPTPPIWQNLSRRRGEPSWGSQRTAVGEKKAYLLPEPLVSTTLSGPGSVSSIRNRSGIHRKTICQARHAHRQRHTHPNRFATENRIPGQPELLCLKTATVPSPLSHPIRCGISLPLRYTPGRAALFV